MFSKKLIKLNHIFAYFEKVKFLILETDQLSKPIRSLQNSKMSVKI